MFKLDDMYYNRTLEGQILRASKQFPVLLLTGPRQVGKTTILKYLCGKDARKYVTLDDINLRGLAISDPELFLQRFNPPILIDEIQYAPELLPYIKIYADSGGKKGSFWLTGSQQFHMMKNVNESLAGRVAVIYLSGFSRGEKYRLENEGPFLPQKKYAFNKKTTDVNAIFKDIWLGFYPALCTGAIKDRNLFYSSYIQTYIERDIRDLTQVGDAKTFYKFIQACAARTSQIINLSDIARDTDVSVTTAKKWLGILETGMQIFILRPYQNNLTKRLTKTPKLYFSDTGLCSYLTGWSSPETLLSGSMNGAIFENFVIIEILKSWHYNLKTPEIYYFRDKDKREIDLIIEQDNTLYPIEVKLGAIVKEEWGRQFKSLHRLKKGIGPGAVISLVKNSIPINRDIWALNAGNIF